MNPTDWRTAAIEKLCSLSPDDALKVFIFMAGLEAGLKNDTREKEIQPGSQKTQGPKPSSKEN